MSPPGLTLAAAAAPLVVVLVAMLWRGWPALRAGALALLVALVVAAARFGWGSADDALGVLAESLFLTATIVWILLPALALHHLQERSGAHEALKLGLTQLTRDRATQVLILGWFLALFFEGAAGFGTPVALTAPLLVTLGLPAVRALAISLVGHCLGVAFGALATPLLTQATLTGVSPEALAWRTALLLAAVGPLVLVTWRLLCPVGPLRPPMRMTALALVAFLGPCAAIATFVGPELATLGGALLGLVLFMLVGRRGRPSAEPRPSLKAVLWPFAVLVALVLVTRLVPPVSLALKALTMDWSLVDGRYHGSVALLLHPGTLLLLAFVVGGPLGGAQPSSLAEALGVASRRLAPVAASMVVMLGLSRLMLHAGLLEALEAGAVASVGRLWPAVAPSVGAVGSFVTGSATASNVLFGALQAETARTLGLSPEWVGAAQNVGAALGNVISPQNVIAGAVTVGATGDEGAVLRLTIPICLATLLLAGLVTAIATQPG